MKVTPKENYIVLSTVLNFAYENYGISLGKVYTVIGIEADKYRILNDENDPTLYPPELFEIIDKNEPVNWITEYGEDGERYSYPPELNDVGFFEDYHNRDDRAINIFWNYINKL